MLKTVSSITNAIGALNFKGTWDANANSPALTSSVGTKGDYYVVGTAGSTNLNGISNWGVGDLATFNGSVWQRVEGGADLNGVNLSVSGTSTLSGLTASTALALNASKEIVSVTNTGTGNNVLATTPTLVGDVTLSTGNLIVADTKGIDFSATPGTGTSELLADYEEGTWTPTLIGQTTDFTSVTYTALTGGKYVKIGNLVHFQLCLQTDAITVGPAAGNLQIGGLPFTATTSSGSTANGASSASISVSASWTKNPTYAVVNANTTVLQLYYRLLVTSDSDLIVVADAATGAGANFIRISGTYVSQ
jgi:hypothetical protein